MTHSGGLVGTVLAAILMAMALLLAAASVEAVVSSGITVTRRALFLAELARFDALLTRACARASTDPGLTLIRGSTRVDVHVDGQTHRFTRLRIGSVSVRNEPIPSVHVGAYDPHRSDAPRWSVVVPFGTVESP